MKGKNFTEEFEFLCALYKDDVSSNPLKTQLETLATQISEEFNFTGFDKIHETHKPLSIPYVLGSSHSSENCFNKSFHELCK